MALLPEELAYTRREFFTAGASGLGGLALVDMLAQDGLLAAEKGAASPNPLAVKAPHFAPKAKSCT